MSAVDSLVLALIGTAVLIAVAVGMGFGRVVPFADAGEARASIEEWLPGVNVVVLALATDRLAALARVEGGALVMAVAVGDRKAVNLVGLERLSRPTPSLLEVAAGGTGQPRRVFSFEAGDLDQVLA